MDGSFGSERKENEMEHNIKFIFVLYEQWLLSHLHQQLDQIRMSRKPHVMLNVEHLTFGLLCWKATSR